MLLSHISVDSTHQFYFNVDDYDLALYLISDRANKILNQLDSLCTPVLDSELDLEPKAFVGYLKSRYPTLDIKAYYCDSFQNIGE